MYVMLSTKIGMPLISMPHEWLSLKGMAFRGSRVRSASGPPVILLFVFIYTQSIGTLVFQCFVHYFDRIEYKFAIV